MAEGAIELFFSYSHKDEDLRDQLANHLKILERQGVISSWHDRRILPGEEWDHQINDNLNSADVILLLISADFIASNYCWDVEVQTAMKRHETGEACVIPIILRRVDWSGAPFGKLQFLPKNALPVMAWSDRDEAFENVTKGIRAAANKLITERRQKRIASKKEAAIVEYQQKVEEFAADGEISGIESMILEDLQETLGLTDEEARTLRDKALEPFGEYQKNLDKYKQAFTNEIAKQGSPLSDKTQADLKLLQNYLKLKDEDVRRIEGEIVQPLPINPPRKDDPPYAQLLSEQSGNTVELRSEGGIDYTRLQNLLQEGRWFEADQATKSVMLRLVDRTREGWFRVEDIEKIPSQDLQTIDQLWLHHSKGRFGFSQQKPIWQEVGGNETHKFGGHEAMKIYQQLGERVGWHDYAGWITYDNLNFTLEAPVGHFPIPYGFCNRGQGCEAIVATLFLRQDL